ncbi:phosphonate metabolism protein (transferase hexapeptide repeat family) [Bradyrhizobium diazoefficiens]
MAGKALSVQPTIDPSAKLHETRLGAYTEVGARTILHEVTMGDYSYVVNDSQITYTTIGKFCSIAAMTRINPGNHPMHRATQAHFTYRSSAYFPGESDDTEFFDWRRQHHVHIGHDAWIGHGAIVLPGRQHRHRRGDRGRRHRHQGRARLHHRRRQSRADRKAALLGRDRRTACAARLVGLGSRQIA